MPPKPSIPKQYADQKNRVVNAYKELINGTGDDTWVKVDVKQCIADEFRQFTVQIKKAKTQDSEWKDAGKVVVVSPSMWGRWNDVEKDNYLKASFEKFV